MPNFCGAVPTITALFFIRVGALIISGTYYLSVGQDALKNGRPDCTRNISHTPPRGDNGRLTRIYFLRRQLNNPPIIYILPTSGMTARDLKVESLAPRVDKKYAHLVPRECIPVHASVILADVSTAVSNAMRRTIACELPVKAMWAEYDDFATTEPSIIPEMVINRIRMIPLVQSTPDDARWELDVTNTGAELMDVKAAEIRPVGRHTRPAFNRTFTLCTLSPGATLRMKIRVHVDHGYVSGSGMHVVACNVTSICADPAFTPLDAYAGAGVSCSISDPRVHRLSFNTNGTMEPRDIIVAAADSLIERTGQIKSLLNTPTAIEGSGGQYQITVVGESDSLGNLYMKTICELYPAIGGVKYSTNHLVREMTIYLRCIDEPRDILAEASDAIIATYVKIKNAL